LKTKIREAIDEYENARRAESFAKSECEKSISEVFRFLCSVVTGLKSELRLNKYIFF
jgi:hypothetical protein